MYNIYHSSLSDETCTTERGLDLVIRVFYALKFSSKYDRYVHIHDDLQQHGCTDGAGAKSHKVNAHSRKRVLRHVVKWKSQVLTISNARPSTHPQSLCT